MNPYKKIFQAFRKNKVEYLIVGGVAVNLYGYSRFTGDLDILLALKNSNLRKVDKIMSELGYVRRLPVEIFELDNKTKVRKWIKEKGMTAYTFISEKYPQLNLDILVGHSFSFARYAKNKTKMEVWGLELPVVSLNDLISMKRKAGREQDLLDLHALLELKRL